MNVSIDTGDTGLVITYKSASMAKIERECEINGFEIASTAKMKRQLNMAGSRVPDLALSSRVRADGNQWVEDRAALVRSVIGSPGAINRMMAAAK